MLSPPNFPSRWAAAAPASTGAIGSPVSPRRGPRSAAALMRRLASVRLISAQSAIACDSLPPSSSVLAWRARLLIS
ncbi:hypothetical protein LAUMK35_05766 [Mycobacterium pseudokansasii]|nr:hypothetical protein LAUMK35_05766 [Mycobacterium pseudokansasii]